MGAADDDGDVLATDSGSAKGAGSVWRYGDTRDDPELGALEILLGIRGYVKKKDEGTVKESKI